MRRTLAIIVTACIGLALLAPVNATVPGTEPARPYAVLSAEMDYAEADSYVEGLRKAEADNDAAHGWTP